MLEHARVKKLFGIIAAAGMASTCLATVSHAQDAWSKTIAHTPAPHAGCFHAAFPSTKWAEVACHVAPDVRLPPAHGPGAGTVGNGDDYAAVVSGTVISSGTGFFPKVKGLKKETGDHGPNSYSLQLNSNFMSGSTACAGAADPAQCYAYEQFIMYSLGGGTQARLFIQYWLVDFNAPCPTGWTASDADCYSFSGTTQFPPQLIKQLKSLSLTGSAVAGGEDMGVVTTKTDAYMVTGDDSVLDLADLWTESEFNVLGADGGTEAVFNPGASLTVQLDLTDGQTTAPVCQANDGHSAETNNLNLGACTASGGTTPSISFVESLPKKD